MDLSRTTFTRFTSFWVGPRLGGVEEIAFEMFYADRWRFFDPHNAPSTCAAPQTLAWSAIYCQSPSPLICNSCMCFLVTIATHPVLVHVLLAITIDTRFKYSFLACNLNQRWNATWSTSSWGNSTHREETWTSSNLARSVNYSRSWGRDRARHGRANNGRQGGWPRDPKKNMTWKSKVKYKSRRQSSWKSIDSTNETNKNQTRRACNQVLETKKKLMRNGVENQFYSVGLLKATKKYDPTMCCRVRLLSLHSRELIDQKTLGGKKVTNPHL